jgi:hypothetical protein
MGKVTLFPRHKLRRCTDHDCRGCSYCIGKLVSCERCGGTEGSLPTDCPGFRMSEVTQENILAGRLDFTRKKGWHMPMTKEGKVAPAPCLSVHDVEASAYDDLDTFVGNMIRDNGYRD